MKAPKKNTHATKSKARKPSSAEPNSTGNSRVCVTRLGIERMLALNLRFRKEWYRRDADLKFPDATELAAELGVSEKTVREDIKFMHDRLRLPCQYIAKRRGYGYTEEVTSFPLTQVSRGDIVLYSAAWSALESFRGVPFSDRASTAFDKVLKSFGSTSALDPARIRRLISFRPGSYYSVVDPHVFELLSTALIETEEVRFTYTKLAKSDFDRAPKESEEIPLGPTERHVQPRHLGCIDSTWYLFADDLIQNAPRTFAVSRISNVLRTGLHFVPTTPFDIEEKLEYAFGAHTSGKKMLVHVRFRGVSASIVAERHYYGTKSKVRNPDGSLDLVREVRSSPELPNWVLGWGADAEVIEPQTLKQQVDDIVRVLYSRLPK